VWQEGSVKHEHDGNPPGDHNEQRDQKLHAAGHANTAVFSQQRSNERASRDPREHRKPAIGDRQRSFVNKQNQSTNSREKEPKPPHGMSSDHNNFLERGG
jgi:hypothetical protein